MGADNGKSKNGLALIVSGCSGTGKTTVIRRLLELLPDLHFSVSCTTRAPRPGEADGVDYHFVGRDEFLAMVGRGEFLEHAEVHGNFYGTPRREVEAFVFSGRNVLLDIDVQGARQVRRNIAGTRLADICVSVFVGPPSFAEAERRLRKRGTDSAEVIARRLANARGELAAWQEYDHLVINDEVDAAARRLLDILRTPQLPAMKQPPCPGWPFQD